MGLVKDFGLVKWAAGGVAVPKAPPKPQMGGVAAPQRQGGSFGAAAAREYNRTSEAMDAATAAL